MESKPFRLFRSLGRSRQIITVLLQHGFGDVVERLHLRRYMQWGWRLLFRKPPETTTSISTAARVRLALESLGATFIKFGQVISTRPDLVPPDVIDELSRLRENVPPFPSDQAAAMLQDELKAPPERLLARFESDPIAAGSLAQVHRAVSHEGRELAIKIRRPDVVNTIERDLDLMIELAILAERQFPEAAVFDPVGLVSHFDRTIRRELNFHREAQTIDEFARLFQKDATLHVPKVHWDLTTEAVLTMDYIDGWRIDDHEALQAAGISPHDVAANGARIYMKMAFELGIFHGDPHPGNIRIMPDGSICLLDYGMIGVIEEETREQLVDLFLGVIRQDTARTVDVVLAIGQPFGDIDQVLLRSDVRDFVASYYGLPLERLNMGRMLSDFVAILANNRVRCPPDLMLLIRALVTLEGVGRRLDPEFNLAEYLTPFVERIVRERYNPRRIAERVFAEAKTFLRLAHDLPLQVSKTLEKVNSDDLNVQFQHRGLNHLITELDRSSNRIVISVVMSSLILASALIIRTAGDSIWLSMPVFVLSSLLGAWLIYGVFRSGRL